MSQATESDTLTDEERENFEWLSDHYEGKPIGEFFEAVLHSDESEEANS